MTALAYDGASGTFSLIGTWPLLPDGFQGVRSGADVEVHPSGRFVYGSNRGHDSIAMFEVDEESGDFGYAEQRGGRALLELAPVPSWHALQFRR